MRGPPGFPHEARHVPATDFLAPEFLLLATCSVYIRVSSSAARMCGGGRTVHLTTCAAPDVILPILLSPPKEEPRSDVSHLD